MARRKFPLLCIPKGYHYVFEGKRNWRRSKDDAWDTQVGKTMCGRMQGARRIDGSGVTVIKVRGRYYAAKSGAIRSPGGR